MKWQVLCAALTGLCLALGGLAQGPTIGPCGAPDTTENFNDSYISKLHEEGFMVVMAEGQQLSDKQLKFFDNGTYLCEYLDRAGRSAQHTGEYRAQAHAASAPATITLHSLPSAEFGGGSGAVTFSVIKAERGVLDLISCSREGLLSRERRHVLISTKLLRSITPAGVSLYDSAYGNLPNHDVRFGELLRSGNEAIASPRYVNLSIIPLAIKSFPGTVVFCLFSFGSAFTDLFSCFAFFKEIIGGSIFPSQPVALLYNTEPAFVHSIPTFTSPQYQLQH